MSKQKKLGPRREKSRGVRGVHVKVRGTTPKQSKDRGEMSTRKDKGHRGPRHPRQKKGDVIYRDGFFWVDILGKWWALGDDGKCQYGMGPDSRYTPEELREIIKDSRSYKEERVRQDREKRIESERWWREYTRRLEFEEREREERRRERERDRYDLF